MLLHQVCIVDVAWLRRTNSLLQPDEYRLKNETVGHLGQALNIKPTYASIHSVFLSFPLFSALQDFQQEVEKLSPTPT